MIKRYRYALIIGSVTVAAILVFTRSNSPEISVPTQTRHKIDVKNQMIDGKKVVGLNPGTEEEDLKTLKITNTVSTEWEENLESSIRLQGGNSVQDITFDKVESFLWAHDGVALNVESLIVRVRNSKNEETSFKVLVDAQSGKILKNWDQPVIDPVNPRDSFGIKLDSRYHSE